jgi:hypothetical protein
MPFCRDIPSFVDMIIGEQGNRWEIAGPCFFPTTAVTGHAGRVTVVVGFWKSACRTLQEREPIMVKQLADRSRIDIKVEAGVTTVSLGRMEIWDGPDLFLIREVLTELIEEDRSSVFSIDMRAVKHVPTGFFGMVSDWQDEGIRILLLDPKPHVREMLWFDRFYRERPSRHGMYGYMPRMTPLPQ